jgi:hypothetical protein
MILLYIMSILHNFEKFKCDMRYNIEMIAIFDLKQVIYH